jgi:hypothetical protein
LTITSNSRQVHDSRSKLPVPAMIHLFGPSVMIILLNNHLAPVLIIVAELRPLVANYVQLKKEELNFDSTETELQSWIKLDEITWLEKQCANRKGPENHRVSDPGEFKLGCSILQDGRIIAD